VQRLTQEAFGYEWTWAADYDANNFSDWLPEGFIAETLFAGKVGLEVGCGAGRHAYRNSQFAQMHFAVDLSRAVDSAFVRNRYSRNCHIVQADAFSLPFRPSTFDYVYCLGVLQHMHDPPVGFRELSKQPKQGGILLVNVYQASRPWTEGALECVRAVSTRLSNENLKRISVVAGYLEYGLLTAPWKLLRQTQFGRMIRPLVPMRVDEYAKHDLRTAIVDWFDRLSCPVKLHFRREDLMRWYAECGYEDIVVTPYWKAFWNGYGRRRNDAIPG
jgi:SAM-dependent methyltransferase